MSAAVDEWLIPSKRYEGWATRRHDGINAGAGGVGGGNGEIAAGASRHISGNYTVLDISWGVVTL